ncbi:protein DETOXIFICATION 45, chloroplastic isoform X1 [Canna indica]|uniref:Protein DETOXIFICATION n=1 Tax=Canna indica TaxID=4628 RepID=A0AAQ3KRN9_9LILI|nr:protein DETOXIFICATION 45, chloroplastic isoform X1 [Canna indica]
MKSIQQSGLVRLFASCYHDGKPNKEIKLSSTDTCRSNRRKDSLLAINQPKITPSVAECRRRMVPVVRCQSSSDCNMDGYITAERFTQKTEQPSSGIKDHLLKLVGGPDGESHPSSVRTELMLLALPAILGQAIDPLAQLMETAYIGRLGPLELASAGVSVSIFNIVSKIFNVPLLSVTTSFVAEDISKSTSNYLQEENFMEKQVSNENERLQLPSISSALLLSAAIGIIEALGLSFGAGFFLNLMGVPIASPMHKPAQLFLCLRALGAPAVVIALAIQGVFRGFKDTKTPLLCLGLGNLSAVLLLPILVYSFRLGIIGAAIATIASQYITTFLLIWSLSKRAVLLPPRAEDLQFGGYFKSGGLMLGRTLSCLLTLTFGTSMAARQGPLAMAAHQICLQVWLAVSLLSDALAVSAQALIASSFAKCDYDRVKQVTYYVLKAGLITGIALTIVLGASFGNLAELFTKDAGVLQIVRSGVLFVSATQPINALAFIFDGLQYGICDFAYSAWSMMLVGAVSSAFLFYAPTIFGISGVWSGLTLFMSLRMIAGYLRLNWRTGPWWFLHQETPKFKIQYTPESLLPVQATE